MQHPMWQFLNNPVEMTAQEFEQYVAHELAQLGRHLPAFEVQRLETIPGTDGEYEIDVTARFEALGVNFLVLVECKHHKNAIKRDIVQILFDRLRAVGGNKGIVYATAPFQRGAIEYAQVHGISLIQIVDGRATYAVKSQEQPYVFPTWIPRFASFLRTISPEGNESFQRFIVDEPKILLEE